MPTVLLTTVRGVKLAPKDYSLAEEWGLPMYTYFVCVLLLVRDSELATHPYSSDMDTHELAANSTASLRCFLQHPTNQFVFVGERASDCFYWSSPFAAKQSLKCFKSR